MIFGKKHKNRVLGLLLVLPWLIGSDLFAAEKTYLPEIKKVSEYVLHSRIEKFGSLERAGQKEKWVWGPGVMMWGLMEAHKLTKNDSILLFCQSWIDQHTQKTQNLVHTDQITPYGVMAQIILDGRLDRQYTQKLEPAYRFLADGARSVEGNRDARGRRRQAWLYWKGRTWLDDLFMTGLFMQRYAVIHQDESLQEAVSGQFKAHLELLQCHGDTSNLLNHGQFLLPNGQRWFPSGKVAWARANGWFLAALADHLKFLPEGSENEKFLRSALIEILREGLFHQQADGLLPTVLDRPDAYGEVAATALFMHVLAVSLREGWVQGTEWESGLEKGMSGILNNIDEKGKVSGVSAGTPVMPFAWMYKGIKQGTYPWGEGAVLMALVSCERLEKSHH